MLDFVLRRYLQNIFHGDQKEGIETTEIKGEKNLEVVNSASFQIMQTKRLSPRKA